MQLAIARLLFVAALVAGPLTRDAEPANAPSDTATATIDPRLSLAGVYGGGRQQRP